jgi:hypothetical protein
MTETRGTVANAGTSRTDSHLLQALVSSDLTSIDRMKTTLSHITILLAFTVFNLLLSATSAFCPSTQSRAVSPLSPSPPTLSTTSRLPATVPDLETVALVAGQENYGLAVVLLGEAFWSFGKAPSVDHGIKTLLPAFAAALVLVVGSGPMITSGDVGSVATGLWIATFVSIVMGGAYLARCLAQYSPSPKEIPALGVLVALAGFFSFSQNLVVDGFVTLPSIPLPTLPSIQLPF